MAAAVRAARLYSVGHTQTVQALRSAQQALRAYVDAFGPLDVRAAARGVVFDFSPQVCEDELTIDLRRALDRAGVDGLRFLPGLSAADLDALVEALALPPASLERAGGLGRLLAGRGVGAVLALRPEPSTPGAPHAAAVLRALRERPADVPLCLRELAGSDPQAAVEVLQAVDAEVASWPAAEREQAWACLADSVLRVDEPLRTALCRTVVDRLTEPWAASLAARWPAVVAGALVAGGEDLPGRLRGLHRGPPDGPLPDAPPPADPQAVRTGLESGVGRAQVASRLVDAIASLQPAHVAEMLATVEQVLREAVASGDGKTVARILLGLDRLARRLSDARGDEVRRGLIRMMTADVRTMVGALVADLAASDPAQTPPESPAQDLRELAELVRLLRGTGDGDTG